MGIKAVFARVRLIVTLLAASCFLCGCVSYGTAVDTKLELEKDLSGVRIMDVSFYKRTFSRNFNGSVEDLDRVIAENCPEELIWSHETKDDKECYHVELPFDSPFDYRVKVMVITGRSVDLEIRAADSVWEKGIVVKEGFTSSDLLEWMKKALVAEGMVEEELADRIFGMEGGAVVYDGKNYPAGAPVQIDEMMSAPPDKLEVRTTMKDTGRYDRSYTVFVPQKSLDLNGEEIKAYLGGLVPADAASVWGAYENGEMLSVTEENMDLSELNAFSRTFLNAPDSGASVTDAASEAKVFSFVNDWNEKLDLAAFCSAGNEAVTVGYYVKPENGAEISGQPDPGRASDDDGYLLLSSGKTGSLDVTFRFAKVYRIRHTDINTRADATGKLDRTMTLTLAEMPDAAHRDQIVSRLRGRSAGTGAVVEEVSAGHAAGLETVAAEDGFAVAVTATGDAAAVASAYSEILGGKTEIRWEMSGGLFSVRKSFSYQETADYRDFLADVTDDHGITYMLEFVGTGCAPAKMDQKSQDALDASGLIRMVDGKTVIYETAETSYTVTESAYGVHVQGVIFWIVILLAAVIAVAAAIRCVLMRKEKREAGSRQMKKLTKRAEEKKLRRAAKAAERAEAEAAEAARQLTGRRQDADAGLPAEGPAEREDGQGEDNVQDSERKNIDSEDGMERRSDGDQ